MTHIRSQDVSPALAFAEANRERLVDLCAALVASDSAQLVGDTTGAVAALEQILREAGLKPDIRRATERKPNLVCTFGGAKSGPHLIFNGHLDTLNAGDAAAWSVPIHELGRRDGRLTGLGVGNMKAGVAALTMAFLGLYQRRSEIAGRITLTAVADEVVFGPAGSAFLLDSDPDLTGDALINAEGPGNMTLAVAEKGLLWLAAEAEAAPAQGMLTRAGASAAARLARFIAEIDTWNDDDAVPPPGMEALADHAGEHGLRLSVNTGTLQGGHFISQVAARVRAEIDFRVPPGMGIDAIEARARAAADIIGGITLQRIKGWDPNWTPIGHPLSQAVAAASAAVRGAPAAPVVRLPASDASRWRARGVPSICFGPQAELVSGVDDYVIENDVVDCVAIYMIAASAICAPGGGEACP